VFVGQRGLDANLPTSSTYILCFLRHALECSMVCKGWKPAFLQYLYFHSMHILVEFGGVRGLEASLLTVSVPSIQTYCIHVLVVFVGVRRLEANLFTIYVFSLQARTGCFRWCSRVGSQSVNHICILSSGTYWWYSVACKGWKPVCSQYMYPLFRHVLVVFGGVRGLEASLFTISVSSLQAHTGGIRRCSRVGSQSVHNIYILSSGTYWWYS